MDCALLIYDKENSAKKNSKVNILLTKKVPNDDENKTSGTLNTSTKAQKISTTTTTTATKSICKNELPITSSPSALKSQTSLTYDKLHMNRFLNNNSSDKINFDILNSNQDNDNDNGGFFIPEEDEEVQ